MGILAGMTRFFLAIILVPIASILLFLMFAIPIAFKLFGTYIIAGLIILLIWKFRKQIVKLLPAKRNIKL
jgi:hypothetical protein